MATVEPCKGKPVPCLLWEITSDDEEALDRYEGFPFLYRKETVKVKLGKKNVEAMVYIMNEGRPLGTPSCHYYSIILEGYNRAGFDIGILKQAVEDGTLTGGIMYECIKKDIPYVLAGSIRDDGPLPDVITDTAESQKLMRKQAQEVDMVIMIATMLHSIAMGNLLPSKVKSICVDINPATVTKLSDRGSAQVVSIVTDIGTFLPLLYESLHESD